MLHQQHLFAKRLIEHAFCVLFDFLALKVFSSFSFPFFLIKDRPHSMLLK